MLGLKNSEVRLVPYQQEWKRIFSEEQNRLSQLVTGFEPIIEHIGSTAIPGISAKPILDIMIGLDSLDKVDLFPWTQFNQYDYYLLPKVQISGKKVIARFTDLQTQSKTIVAHVVVKNNTWWNVHLFFRDYLLDYSHERFAYEQLKQELASKFPSNQTKYTTGKLDYVNHILSKRGEDHA
ncbi:GrpB family protein [Bacillus sp. JCM 19041]|uniref:GrpB family protein n=1 Tax=Bacillus sp. JCM 19041 TaxID=1460637 RepID=UPI0006CF891F